jgi:CMP-N-acetylneuraminic acid synthetase
MSTVTLIPARGGSKGLPGKNLAEIGGRSLVARAVDVARAVPGIGEVVVSSDDDAILAEGERAGAIAERRPSELAADETATLELVQWFVHGRPTIERLVLLQPTSPLRERDDVVACLDALDRAPVAATVTAVEHPVEWLFCIGREGMLEPLRGWDRPVARRQDAAATYVLNGAVYAARGEHVRAGGGLVGPGTVGVVMPRERSVDVDDALDLEWARLLARRSGPPRG